MGGGGAVQRQQRIKQPPGPFDQSPSNQQQPTGAHSQKPPSPRFTQNRVIPQFYGFARFMAWAQREGPAIKWGMEWPLRPAALRCALPSFYVTLACPSKISIPQIAGWKRQQLWLYRMGRAHKNIRQNQHLPPHRRQWTIHCRSWPSSATQSVAMRKKPGLANEQLRMAMHQRAACPKGL